MRRVHKIAFASLLVIGIVISIAFTTVLMPQPSETGDEDKETVEEKHEDGHTGSCDDVIARIRTDKKEYRIGDHGEVTVGVSYNAWDTERIINLRMAKVQIWYEEVLPNGTTRLIKIFELKQEGYVQCRPYHGKQRARKQGYSTPSGCTG
jgi:hypothetical protein